jgi:hypothetical protein
MVDSGSTICDRLNDIPAVKGRFCTAWQNQSASSAASDELETVIIEREKAATKDCGA